MAGYIFTIGYEDRSNWGICRETRLLGVRSSPSAHASARSVAPGDEVYVWLGGASRPGSGLIARVRAVGTASESLPTPWPQPEIYSYKIPIVVDHELEEAIPDRFPGHRLSLRFNLQNTDVQKGLRPITGDVAAKLARAFPQTGVEEASEPSVALDGGWSQDQDLVKRVESAALAAVRRYLHDAV